MTITPDTVAAILAQNKRSAVGHHLNANHPEISRCKLGAVFVNNAGDYCVYTGIEGNNRKYPVLYVRVRDRQPRKGQRGLLAKVIAASAD